MRALGSSGPPSTRVLHPLAWWAWAIGMATAASRTTNPVLLLLLLAVVGQVVAARRGDAPWARGFRTYLLLGLLVIAIRVLYRIVLGGDDGTHVLVTLPEVPLPDSVKGIRLGGPVTAEGALAAAYDGLRLAVLLACVGAANVLADPKRLLRSLPSALHDLGVAATVSLSVAPQLVESAQRVRRARRLRGETGRRTHIVRTVLLPVLTDALDRSLLLAAAMDSRGYGRRGAVPGSARATAVLLLGGLLAACVGTYGLLDGTAPRWIGLPMLIAGTALAVVGMVRGGRGVRTTRYRPDPWRRPEWVVARTGVGVAAVMLGASSVDPNLLVPSLVPLSWPSLPAVPAVAVLVGLLPAWVAPIQVRSSVGRPAVVGAA